MGAPIWNLCKCHDFCKCDHQTKKGITYTKHRSLQSSLCCILSCARLTFFCCKERVFLCPDVHSITDTVQPVVLFWWLIYRVYRLIYGCWRCYDKEMGVKQSRTMCYLSYITAAWAQLLCSTLRLIHPETHAETGTESCLSGKAACLPWTEVSQEVIPPAYLLCFTDSKFVQIFSDWNNLKSYGQRTLFFFSQMKLNMLMYSNRKSAEVFACWPSSPLFAERHKLWWKFSVWTTTRCM